MTTSWPWMEGIELGIAEPIGPVNEADTRPAVQDLITQYRDSIDQVKAAIENNELYHPTKHDDLWILRFVLSHKKKVKDSIKAAEHTLSFRAERNLDTTDIRFHPPGREDALWDGAKRYLKYCSDDALRFVLPDPQRGVVGFLNFAGIDQHALVKNLDPNDWLPLFLYVAEWTHQWLDYVTRTTGRLTKSVRLAETSETKFSQFNSECHKRDAAAMELLEDIYPQLLQTVYICHAPAWVQVPWRLIRPFLPRRVVAKIDFINPDKNRKERQRLLEYIDEDHLPTRFGGRYESWPVAFPLPGED